MISRLRKAKHDSAQEVLTDAIGFRHITDHSIIDALVIGKEAIGIVIGSDSDCFQKHFVNTREGGCVVQEGVLLVTHLACTPTTVDATPSGFRIRISMSSELPVLSIGHGITFCSRHK